jgi:hypothetical protein
MKPVQYLRDEEVIERGVAALLKALGPVETSRFFHLQREGRIESVKRHRRWQAGLDQEHFFDQVFGEERSKSI